MQKSLLQRYFNRVVRVYLRDSTDEIVGKLIGLNEMMAVIKGRGTPDMIEIKRIDGIETVLLHKKNTLYRRRLRLLGTNESAKQHLVDRHGQFFDMIAAIDEEAAKTYHYKIDHSLLGHEHVPDRNQDLDTTTEYEEA